VRRKRTIVRFNALTMSKEILNLGNQNIENRFEGKTVCIFAGGSSLRGFDFDRYKKSKTENIVTIAVNHGTFHMESDYFAFIDPIMIQELEAKRGKGWSSIVPCICAEYSGAAPEPEKIFVVRIDNRELHLNPPTSPHRSNSTSLAIGFSLLANAKKIYVLGLDGGSHWYLHPAETVQRNSMKFFEQYKEKITLVGEHSFYKEFCRITQEKFFNDFAIP